MDKVQCDGAIFTNDYKQNEKQPDWTGTIEIPKELLKDLVEKVKQGQTAELRVALWDRTSKNGKDYKYASCLLYTSPSPRDVEESRMPSSA